MPGGKRSEAGMVSDGAVSTMLRKTGAGRPRLDAGGMTLQRAWRLSIPKAAEEAAGLVAALRGMAEEKVPLETIVGNPGSGPGDGALFVLLEGRDDRFGLAVLDAAAVAALIEVQTTGRVLSSTPAPRKPTRTDAMLCADLIDRLLEVFEETVAGMDPPPPVEGYRYAMPLDDQRAIELVLPECAYLAMTLTIDFGRGARVGTLRIAVPAGSSRAADGASLGPELEATLMDAETTLTAVLHRVRLPLDALTRLRPGDLVPVPLSAVARLALEAPGAGVVGHARLGQMNGYRAVRMLDPEAQPRGEAGPEFAAVRMPAAMAPDRGNGADGDFPLELAELPPVG